MDWLRALQHLRDTRTPGVLVTITQVRGHAPRASGAKLVVAAGDSWGSIGGGNLEECAVRRARALLHDAATAVLVLKGLGLLGTWGLGVAALGYAVGLGVSMLPLLCPAAYLLPYDVMTVPLVELGL